MTVLKLTSSFKAILEEADVPLDFNSCGIQNLLCNGILLSKGTKKFLLDKSLNVYTIIFFARGLTIAWIDDRRYWKWIRESCGSSTEVAELIQVSWLDISGKIQASKLLSGIRYEILFEILIKTRAGGFEIPVTLKLSVPNQCPQEHKVCLNTFPREKWVEISVGIFTLSEADICGCGDIEFSLFEHGGHWKSGLLVKSATIRPKLLCG